MIRFCLFFLFLLSLHNGVLAQEHDEDLLSFRTVSCHLNNFRGFDSIFIRLSHTNDLTLAS